MREIRKSASMSGDGKRDHDAPGVQRTRARSRLYPRGEAKCLIRKAGLEAQDGTLEASATSGAVHLKALHPRGSRRAAPL